MSEIVPAFAATTAKRIHMHAKMPISPIELVPVSIASGDCSSAVTDPLSERHLRDVGDRGEHEHHQHVVIHRDASRGLHFLQGRVGCQWGANAPA